MVDTQFRLNWCQGYEAEKLHFVTEDTVCHACGNNIKFHSESGTSVDFSHDLRNIGQLAVQLVSKSFAIAESNVLNPRIRVYSFPDFKPVSEPMEGAAELEITALAFSSSQFLYAMSGIPDFQLSLWDFRSGVKLATLPLPEVSPQQLLVNPVNWRLIALLHESRVELLEVERCKDLFKISNSTIRLPPVQAELHSTHSCDPNDKNRVPTRASSAGRATGQPQLPESAIAGLDPNFAEGFEEYKDSRDVRRLQGRSIAWSELERDFFVGCSDGCLVRYDDERRVLRVAMRSELRAEAAAAAAAATQAIAEVEEEEEEEAPVDAPTADESGEVSFDLLSLSSSGLLAAGSGEGGVHLLEFNQEFSVTSATELMSSAHPICAFAACGDRVAVGTSDGGVGLMSIGSGAGELKQIYCGGHGDFVGAALLPGANAVVATAREDGNVQMWDTSSSAAAGPQAKLIGSLSLSLECTAFTGSQSSSTLLVGAEDGSVSIIDASRPKQPRLIRRHFLHHAAAVRRIATDPTGRLFATASNDGFVFLVSALASEQFRVIGGLPVDGCVHALSFCDAGDGCVQLVALSQVQGQARPDTVAYFFINQELCDDPANFFGSTRGILADSHVRRAVFRLDAGAYGCALIGHQVPWLMTVSCSSRRLLRYNLPVQAANGEPATIRADMDNSPEIYFEEAKLQLQLHPSGLLLLAFGSDGGVNLVDFASKAQIGRVQAHSFTCGGVLSACLSPDAKFLITSGFDASLCRFEVKLPSSMATEMEKWHLAAAADSMSSISEENAAAAQLKDWTEAAPRAKRRESESDDEEAEEKPMLTWLGEQEQLTLAEEDKKFADKKRELREKLTQMRDQIRSMVDANTNESDLEKLDPHEFELDLDEQGKFSHETDAEVNSVRRRIELENLAKQFLAEVIKRDCWDAMEIRGRSIGSFSSPLEVCNYPLKPLSKADELKLEQVSVRRIVEIEEAKDRKKWLENSGMEQMEGEEDFEATEEKKQTQQGDSVTLQGSSAERFGVLKSMFYSQFHLHSREQKINQIVLLQDSIRHIKQQFNKEFDSVYKKKEQEMAKIQERNLRLKKIVSDLDLDVEVPEPQFSVAEKPELLFTVSDSEITVEKYLTPEQQKKLEEQRLAEEERLRKERMDNWRERGLDQMMGGVLEIKKEDELKKDVPKPQFMLNKQEAEWSEDERKIVEEYERKVKELMEEREKYKKQLEAELKKLQGQTEENMSAFDQDLKQLFQQKVKTQAAVVQEELMIQRLRLSLLVEEEFGVRERELNFMISQRNQQLQQLAPLIDESKRMNKEQDNNILNQKSQNDYLDKSYSAFKREFPEASPVQAEQLHKLFKKKLPQQRIRAGAGDNATGRRPTTASRQDSMKQALYTVLREQDDERNMPPGLDPSVWQRFCQLRLQRRERDMDLEEMTRAQSEFQAFVATRQSEYERLKSDANNLKTLLEQLMEQKAQFISNLEVQLLVRQGQVEVEPKENFIIDFADSLLLHRSVVEELNGKIKGLGEAKVKFMEDARDSKKSFRRLEWELKQMRMEAEDLINQISDINSFKITREIQRYLATEDYDGLITSEIQKLDSAIELMKKHHQKMIEMKEGRLRELQLGKSAALDAKNQELDSELHEMNVCVNERVHIDEVNAEKRDEAYAAQRRYEQILQRQRLVDLAKAQAKEVAVLRAEVERLRMRTFPALVHNK